MYAPYFTGVDITKDLNDAELLSFLTNLFTDKLPTGFVLSIL